MNGENYDYDPAIEDNDSIWPCVLVIGMIVAGLGYIVWAAVSSVGDRIEKMNHPKVSAEQELK